MYEEIEMAIDNDRPVPSTFLESVREIVMGRFGTSRMIEDITSSCRKVKSCSVCCDSVVETLYLSIVVLF